MAELYCNLAIKVQLILKMQLICSLLKNLSFKIIRRLASLLPGKTRRQSYITILYYFFFCGKKIRKENSLNNLTTSILSFSSPPARKVTRERKRAPRGGQLPRGWQFSLISRVHWCVHKPGLRDRSLFIAGGGEDLGQNKVQLNRYTL